MVVLTSLCPFSNLPLTRFSLSHLALGRNDANITLSYNHGSYMSNTFWWLFWAALPATPSLGSRAGHQGLDCLASLQALSHFRLGEELVECLERVDQVLRAHECDAGVADRARDVDGGECAPDDAGEV